MRDRGGIFSSSCSDPARAPAAAPAGESEGSCGKRDAARVDAANERGSEVPGAAATCSCSAGGEARGVLGLGNFTFPAARKLEGWRGAEGLVRGLS